MGVQGTLFRASQFLAEELPIRLAHRVQELETLPDGLNDMPSVKKVAEWYAQSFEVWPHIARAEEIHDSPDPSFRRLPHYRGRSSTKMYERD